MDEAERKFREKTRIFGPADIAKWKAEMRTLGRIAHNEKPYVRPEDREILGLTEPRTSPESAA